MGQLLKRTTGVHESIQEFSDVLPRTEYTVSHNHKHSATVEMENNFQVEENYVWIKLLMMTTKTRNYEENRMLSVFVAVIVVFS